MFMRRTEEISKFFKREAFATNLILEVSAHDEVCNFRSVSGNHLLPGNELQKQRSKENFSPFFSPLLFPIHRTLVRVHARMHVHTKSFCFDSVLPASLYIADVPDFRAGFNFICK